MSGVVVTGEPTPTCVFCRIIEGTEPAEIVDSGPDALTIVPLDPVTDGHVLVIPRPHGRYLWDLTTYEIGAAMFDVALAAKKARPCNVIQSNGEAATQTIGHVHFHVVPRRPNDGLALPWTKQQAVERLDRHLMESGPHD